MNQASRQALLAGIRLGAVLLLLAFALSWWLMQKAPDYRVDQRLRLTPDNDVGAVDYVTLDFDRRVAWTIPAGRQARFHVVIPGDDPAVRFHEGYLQGMPDLAVRMVRSGGERVDIAEFHGSEARWTEHRIELPASANEEVDIEFLCLDGRGRLGLGEMLLSGVVLESDGRPIDETESPVTAHAVGIDLLADAALDKVHAPSTFETSRLFIPGPACLPLEEGISRTLLVDKVPPGAELSVILHVARLGAAPEDGPARVLISADDLVLANVPVRFLAESEGDTPPMNELIVTADLFHWVDKPMALHLELEGGSGLFVGVREVFIRQPQQRLRRPFDEDAGLNTLLVIVDGLRPDRLGCAGYDRGHTPVIDELARTGLRYDYAVAPSSWALPNVATLLTGVHPLTHGLGLLPGRSLSPRLSTLAESASWAGYTTACFTSSQVISEATGLSRGYETFVGAAMTPTTLVERAIDWLPEASQFEWFMTLHFDHPTAPHEPGMANLMLVNGEPDPELEARLAALDSRPGVAAMLATEVGPLYDAEVAGVDRALGMLLEALEERGVLDRTLIVIVGSHGQEFFEHLGRGQGQTLYDEVLHIPVIVSGPGVVGLSTPPLVEREMIQMEDVTQLIGQLGKVMSAANLGGRTPPPFGPSDTTQVAHALLLPYEGETSKSLEASRREGLMLLTDREKRTSTLLDLAPGPGKERDLLMEPDVTRWAEEARALQDAFDEWYRGTVLDSASRPMRWKR